MTKPKILIVEDERVVAADIEESLNKLGYAVVGAAASGVGAIRRAVETEPDLVLMDIKLKGYMDGIDAAGELHDRLGIPVVFLTAYADSEILDRAKKSSPSGYVLKPFDERALRSAVEIALHRYPKEKKLADSERRLITALRGLDDAVILTQLDGRVSFMNKAAERLTGWKQAAAAGAKISDVMVALDSQTGSLKHNTVGRVLREGVSLGLGERTILVSRYGVETWVEGTVTPLHDDDRETVGAAVVFHPAEYIADNRMPADPQTESGRVETLGRLTQRLAAEFAESFDTIAARLDRLCSGLSEEDPAIAEAAGVRELAVSGRHLARRVLSLAQHRSPRPEVVDLITFLGDLEQLLSCAAGQAASLETIVEPHTGSIKADPRQLEQVLLDIVNQCSLRMPLGGRIKIDCDNVELLTEYARAHTALEPGRYVVIVISQAGNVLIPPAADAITDLPAVVRQVRALGGDITLRSEPGRVTTYELYFPRVDDAAA